MLAHGLVSPALFLLADFLYNRYKTQLLRCYNGCARSISVCTARLFRAGATGQGRAAPLGPGGWRGYGCAPGGLAVHDGLGRAAGRVGRAPVRGEQQLRRPRQRQLAAQVAHALAVALHRPLHLRHQLHGRLCSADALMQA